jgi:hypothetical protein
MEIAEEETAQLPLIDLEAEQVLEIEDAEDDAENTAENTVDSAENTAHSGENSGEKNGAAENG